MEPVKELYTGAQSDMAGMTCMQDRTMRTGVLSLGCHCQNATRRKKKMDKQEEKCDGICYAPDKMCPCVEWCEKTRKGEFFATIMAALFVFVITMMLLPGILMLNLADWIYDRLWR